MPQSSDLLTTGIEPAASAAGAVRQTPWLAAAERPLDLDGPAEIPYERFDEDRENRSIASLFAVIAERHATRTAINDGETRLTYAEAWRITRCLARRVIEVAPAGRPVAVMLPNAALFPVAALACLATGRPYVPIDLDYPTRRNAEILREAGANAVITRQGLHGLPDLVPPKLPVIDVTDALSDADEHSFCPAVPNGPAVILYTSGSTGRPKGICNDQHALLQRIAQYTNACHLHADDRFILLSSPSTIAGVRDTFSALLNGATLRIVDLKRSGIGGVQNVIRDENITVYYSVPAVLRALLCGTNAGAIAASLRIVRLGGDTTHESDLAMFRAALPPTCHILVGYGSTEAPTAFQWFAQPGRGDGSRVPCGFPTPGVDFALIAEDGSPISTGVGELVVRSRNLALGLWQDGRLAEGPFQRDPSDASLRIFRTGDLFRINADGLAEACGRNDRQLKIRGIRVDPGEVEAALRRCDGVADAAVVAQGQSGDDIRLVGFVVAREGAGRLNEDDLRRIVSAWLPTQTFPAVINFVEEIPRLPSFKPDYVALSELASRSRGASNATARHQTTDMPLAARSPVADAVRTAWAAQCEPQSLLRGLTWEDAGGDSLKALRLLLHLEEMLGRHLSTDVLARDMTPSSLCAAIERRIEGAPETPASRDADDGRVTVFLMPGILYDELGLARFRHALRGEVRFVLISYPAWRESIAAEADFSAIVAHALEQIVPYCGDAPIHLAGYSFGGFVAFETAHRLTDLGYEVAFLGLLDTRRRSQFADSSIGTRTAETVRLIAEAVRDRDIGVILRAVVRLLLKLGSFRALNAVAALSDKLGGGRAAPHLLYALRSYSLRRWHPGRLAIPTFFFRSEENPSDQPYDCGWGRLCAPLTIVPVPGEHHSMLAPEHTEQLCAEFLAALRANGRLRVPV